MMRALGLVAGVAIALQACGGSDGVGPPPLPPAPPTAPGSLTFDVVTPADVEDGALLITVLGGAVDSVTGSAGYEVFHSATSTGARAIVVGNIVDGPVLRVWVPDVSQAAGYSAQVVEGAVRGTYGLVAAEAYQLTRTP